MTIHAAQSLSYYSFPIPLFKRATVTSCDLTVKCSHPHSLPGWYESHRTLKQRIRQEGLINDILSFKKKKQLNPLFGFSPKQECRSQIKRISLLFDPAVHRLSCTAITLEQWHILRWPEEWLIHNEEAVEPNDILWRQWLVTLREPQAELAQSVFLFRIVGLIIVPGTSALACLCDLRGPSLSLQNVYYP